MIRIRPLVSVAALAALSLAACKGSDGGSPGTHDVGAQSFTSQAPGGAGRGGTGPMYAPGTTTANGSAGVPGAAGAPTTDGSTGSGTPARAIEEADIYKRDGSTLFVLNTYRGLQILDLAVVGAPKLVGHVAVTGNPVDLYVRTSGGKRTAIVAVNDAFAYVVAEDGSTQPHRGSRVLAVDVTDPATPVVLSDLPVEGSVEQTRLVGDILYVASNKYYWYDWVAGGSGSAGGTVTVSAGAGSSGVAVVGGGTTGTDTFFVASFDLSTPLPRAVDRVDFPATGWDVHANVTAERITLSFAGYGVVSGPGTSTYPSTKFQVIDISDPSGKLALGTSFSTVGQVKDRWGMDYDAGTGLFRAAMGIGWNQGAAVEIWSSPTAGAATSLARVPIDVQESLTAARFDGNRIYVVTAYRSDPLWIIDGTDPAKPVVVHSIDMKGQLDFIEPRGDRLVALGHTDEAGQPWQLQVSLLDVGATTPSMISRVLLGTSYGTVAVKADDLRKAFLVFDPPPTGIGLVLVPYNGWDRTTYRSQSGTQLVTLGRDTLSLEAFVPHPGLVTRAFPLDAGGRYLAALSDSALQVIDTVDATRRSQAHEIGRIDLARSVSAIAIVKDKAVELAGDWYTGVTELVVTDALDPDAPVPLARVDVAAPQARLLQDGEILWVLATDWSSYPPKSWLQAVDFSDGAHPVLRGRLDLTGGESFSNVRYWGYANEAVLVGHTLVVHHAGSVCYDVCPVAATGVAAGTATATGAPAVDPSELRIYDLSDPDHPALVSTLAPSGASWAYGLTAFGHYLWLTHFEWGPTWQDGRYYLDRIDLSDPRNPKLLPKINVPGVFVAASPDGSRIFTLETSWDDSWNVSVQLHRLALLGSTAQLEASVPLAGYPSGQAVDGRYAWLAVQPNRSSEPTRLVTIDLSSMTVSDDQAVRGSWAWLRAAAGGKLFLFAGWNEQGVILYDLAAPAHPTFDRFVRTSSWVWDVVVANGRAYLPSGPYGVPVIQLQ